MHRITTPSQAPIQMLLSVRSTLYTLGAKAGGPVAAQAPLAGWLEMQTLQRPTSQGQRLCQAEVARRQVQIKNKDKSMLSGAKKETLFSFLFLEDSL